MVNGSGVYVKYRWMPPADTSQPFPFLIQPASGILASNQSAYFLIGMIYQPHDITNMPPTFSVKCQISNLSLSVDMTQLDLNIILE